MCKCLPAHVTPRGPRSFAWFSPDATAQGRPVRRGEPLTPQQKLLVTGHVKFPVIAPIAQIPDIQGPGGSVPSGPSLR